MTTTVSYYLPEFAQGTLGDDSGMKLTLSKPSDRSAVNGAGDVLLWAGNGWLTAVVGETWAESLAVSVEDADGLILRAGWLGVGSTVVSDVRAELDPAVGAQIDNIENASGYLLAVLAGECADPQTASETYAITVFGSTFTVDMAGQTSAGVRTAPTLTKT